MAIKFWQSLAATCAVSGLGIAAVTLPAVRTALADVPVGQTDAVLEIEPIAPLSEKSTGVKPANSKLPLGFPHGVKGNAGGMASWYGPGFHGRRTANGEIFNQNALTAAHRSLPFGTKVRVTNVNTGRAVVVRINDRGPFVGNRVIDLSRGAAARIGLVNAGVGPVRLEILGR